MRSKLLILAALIWGGSIASADVTVKFPDSVNADYELESYSIANIVKPRSERPSPTVETLKATNGAAVFNQSADADMRYILMMSDDDAIIFYTRPGENLTIDISSVTPLSYSIHGSALMDGISEIQPKADALEAEFKKIARSSNRDEARMEAIMQEYIGLCKDYMRNNPTNPASVYALLQLDGEDYMNGFENLTAELQQSALYPLAVNKKASVEKRIEADRRLEALQSGNVEAPVFTLKNLEGKDVSLSDFRGKWVILDFWGSWCPWCIKGFPSLKEAYAANAGKLEIIGVDCNDPENVWREAVKKYELPWVNVYNAEAGAQKILEDYAVQGFPTKVIVNPEGKIANVTVGEDPAFFSKLQELMSK